MRILALSDSHDRNQNLFYVLEHETYDAVVFTGDVQHGEKAVREKLEKLHPLCPIRFVRGNCDDPDGFDLTAVIPYEGVRFFVTHGHAFGVNYGLDSLAAEAKRQGCGYALFGHIHRPVLEKTYNGVICFNPGSVSEPRQEDGRATYGIITVQEDGTVSFEHKYVHPDA